MTLFASDEATGPAAALESLGLSKPASEFATSQLQDEREKSAIVDAREVENGYTSLLISYKSYATERELGVLVINEGSDETHFIVIGKFEDDESSGFYFDSKRNFKKAGKQGERFVWLDSDLQTVLSESDERYVYNKTTKSISKVATDAGFAG